MASPSTNLPKPTGKMTDSLPIWKRKLKGESFTEIASSLTHTWAMNETLLQKIDQKYGRVPSSWGEELATADNTFPCLRLPSDRIRFNCELGFWPHIKVLRDSSNDRWIALQLASFELTIGPGRDWAIPLAYEARSEEEVIRKELGFDEGWDMSVWETVLLFEPTWLDFFWTVASARVLAITTQGAETAYPLRFQPHQLELLEEIRKR